MTFSAADRLWLLVLPAAVAAAYVVQQVVRRRIAARFVDDALLPSVMPVRTGWQRHLSLVVLVLTLATLTAGFAGPRTSTKVPRKDGVVILAIDTSASMASTDVAPTRLKAAQRSASDFVSALPAGIRAGLVTFGTDPQLLVSPTLDRPTMQAAIQSLQAAHATATAGAIDVALQAIKSARTTISRNLPGTIILLSDGRPSIGMNGLSPDDAADSEARASKAAGVPIDTIAVGTSAGAATMARLAQESGGRTFTAPSAAQLHAVYSTLSRTVGFTKRVNDWTAAFTGAALGLGVLAAAAALAWTRRLA